MHRIILATRNAHKTREFAAVLAPEFLVSDLTGVTGLPEGEETGRTFEENAILKALAASRILPGFVVSDDSGLEVAALNGAPGVRSARYASEKATDAENITKLLTELHALEKPETGEWRARFCCVLGLAADGEVVHLFHATVSGLIITKPRGQGGFGYDPVFVPEGHSQTFSELGENVKNRISHRAQAISQLRRFLEEQTAK